jgi:hypothetical protein
MHEFIHALIRLAWTCYPGGRGGKGSQRRGGDADGPGGRGRKGSPQHGDDADGDGSGSSLPEGMGERLRRLMEQAVLPASEHLLSDDDEAFEAELFGSRRVRAITEYYKEFLVDVFAIYARSDATLNQKAGHLCKMNFAEVIFLCKEGNFLDEQLSFVQMTSLFVKTSACCVGARTHARRAPYIPTTSLPHPHIPTSPHHPAPSHLHIILHPHIPTSSCLLTHACRCQPTLRFLPCAAARQTPMASLWETTTRAGSTSSPSRSSCGCSRVSPTPSSQTATASPLPRRGSPSCSSSLCHAFASSSRPRSRGAAGSLSTERGSDHVQCTFVACAMRLGDS